MRARIGGRAADRRARPRLPPRPRRRGLARRHELLRFPAPDLVVAARRRTLEQQDVFSDVPRRRPTGGGEAGRVDAQFRAGVPWDAVAPLLDAARQPRHCALPHGHRRARPASRRHRPADDDARCADALRRRRARARRRLGRGRTAHDAVGPTRTRGTTQLLARLPRAHRAPPLERRARARRPSLRPRLRRRDRVPARDARGAAALPRGARAARSDPSPFTSLETLYGEDAPNGVLPADGPAFHIWRIS